MDHFIAIDFGAESGRLIVGHLEDQHLEMEELYRFRTQGTPLQGYLRWNVIRFWEEILTGLRKYVQNYGPDAAGIGIDSWGVSIVGLNEYDELAYTPFHYRAEIVSEDVLDAMKKTLGEEYLFNTTGIQFMALNTSTHLFGMMNKFPNLLQNSKTLLMIPDYFYFLLTGKKITEYTNASTTQLLDVFKRTWSKELLNKLGCDATQFPALKPAGTTLGPLSSSVSLLTGLNHANVHVVATHDTGSAIAAIPHPEPDQNWAYLSSGTWSLLGVEIDEPVVNEKIREFNLTNEGGIDGKIRLLKNIMGLWLLQECKREWEAEGKEYSYENLMKMAEESTCNSLVTPDDARFFNPAGMRDEILAYCSETSQSLPESPGDFARLIFQSLACRYREVLNMIMELTKNEIRVIHIVGGGSKNQYLSQITADVCNCNVICGPVESTAIGNLLMQARASGLISSPSELRNIVKNSFSIEKFYPTSGERSAIENLFEKYEQLTKLAY